MVRRAKKIWLIVAAALTGAGLILFAVAFAAMQFQLSGLEMQGMETNVHTPTGEISKIFIQTDTADVTLAPSENGECSVVCREEERATHSVSITGGVLSVKVENGRRWYDYINLSFESPSVTVYLPAGTYEALSVKTHTGSVEIPQVYSFGSMELSTDTGDVRCDAAVMGLLKASSNTGNLQFGGAAAGELSLSASTGTVCVKDVQVPGTVKIKTSTGEITLDGVVSEGTMEITSSTGEVELSLCDASRLQIKTSTGEVEATLLNEKTVDADSSTGDVDVPRNGRGGACVIRTDTGDITVRFVS